MNDLVKIENQNGKLVVSSRVVAEQLGKRHSDVIPQIEKILTNENVRSLIIATEYKDKKGEFRKEYLLTKDGFTLYMFNIQGHNDFKLAYINRFNEMERALKGTINPKQNLLLSIIQSATEVERAVALNKYELEYVKPLENKIEVLTHVNKLYTSTEIAKELGMTSAKALNQILAEKKIQYKVNNTWVLTAKYSNLGYESIKQNVLDNGKVIYDRKFTQEGRDFIIGLLGGTIC